MLRMWMVRVSRILGMVEKEGGPGIEGNQGDR